jgi:serine/threonine-protein kinase SRPK3
MPIADEIINDYDNSSSDDEDYSDDEDEGIDGYKAGGYHPVSIGDKYNNRYVVCEKLGWGHFSTVWMSYDKKGIEKNSPEFVALKIQKSASHYSEAALDEIELLHCASNASISPAVLDEFGPDYDPCVVLLVDNFEHTGPHGRHICMAFEILGENLLKVIKRYNYKGIPVPIVKNIVRQVCVGLDFLHRQCSIIHTDLKPENILITRPKQTPSLESVKNIIQTRSLIDNRKAPEKVKKNNNNANNTGNAIESMEKELKDGKILSTEQRKKLKKKLKKKKQQARKKDETKKRGGGRRKGNRAGSGTKSNKSPSIESNNALKEMMLMEKDSLPISNIVNDNNEGDNKDNINNKSIKYKSNIETNLEEKNNDNSLDQHNSKSIVVDKQDNLADEWFRSTLFAHLNFSIKYNSIEKNIKEDAGLLIYDNSSPISFNSYILPVDEMYSKISVVISTQRLVEIFGNPQRGVINYNETNDEDDDSISIEWFRTLNVANGLPSTLNAEENGMFSIRGHYDDASDLSTLAAYCCINNVSTNPDKYLVSLPIDKANKPMKWSIIHHASMTEHLLSYLETEITGLNFLCHYDIPGAPLLEDDMEMLYIARRLCVHPICNYNSLLEDNEEKIDDYDTPFIPWYDKELPKGCGSLLGIDIDLISNSICIIQNNLNELSSVHFDLTKYVTPLQTRMEYFIGDSMEIMNIAKNSQSNNNSNNNNNGSNQYQTCNINNGYDSIDSLDDDYDINNTTKKLNKLSLKNLDEEYKDAKVKIVDLGNACWTYKHFTDDIQTRQYRSPEVLLGAHYGTSADMWSMACIVFELITGDLLFDPHAGKSWDREEDHLAMICELLGNFPRNVSQTGTRASEYFTRKGELRHIHHLKYWHLQDVLRDKYKLSDYDSVEIANFLESALEINPEKRATALQCLKHPWLQEGNDDEGQQSNYNYSNHQYGDNRNDYIDSDSDSEGNIDDDNEDEYEDINDYLDNDSKGLLS